MKAGWTAGTVRARAMARRRIGAARVRRVAAAATLDDGLAELEGTAFESATPGTAPDVAEQRIRAEELWELRVLAGWMPAPATPLFRALAARFERANIEQQWARLTGRQTWEPFELGSLATSWHRLARTTSADELSRELAVSPWGDPRDPGSADAPGDIDPTIVHDWLVIAWLRMVTSTAPPGSDQLRRWAAGEAALVVARMTTINQRRPTDRFVRAAMPLLGHRWPQSSRLDELHATLPPDAAWVLEAVDRTDRLWQAEARLRVRVEADAVRMLHSATFGPVPVIGAVATLAVDAWRVRAAIAAAAGATSREVLDVAA